MNTAWSPCQPRMRVLLSLFASLKWNFTENGKPHVRADDDAVYPYSRLSVIALSVAGTTFGTRLQKLS